MKPLHVCWVVGRCDITGVDGGIRAVLHGVDPPKDEVDLSVVAAASPPAFDNAFVVSVDDEVPEIRMELGNGTHQEFESNGLCPANVLFICPPLLLQRPGSPSITHDNADPG
jgi:hypothetical protein